MKYKEFVECQSEFVVSVNDYKEVLYLKGCIA